MENDEYQELLRQKYCQGFKHVNFNVENNRKIRTGCFYQKLAQKLYQKVVEVSFYFMNHPKLKHLTCAGKLRSQDFEELK